MAEDNMIPTKDFLCLVKGLDKVPANNSNENSKVLSKEELQKALQSDFATTASKIYINSLDQEVSFREISVLEQKNLSRIMVTNEHRKDIIYDAQSQLINTVCLAKNFDINELTEFDRLKILMALYQANMFQHEVKFTCHACGTENSYTPDFGQILRKLDLIDINDKTVEYENANFKYKFTIGYPRVSRVSKFHNAYFFRHRNEPKSDVKGNELMSNMEYVNLYIKQIEITVKANGNVRFIDMNDYKVQDVEDILSMFPQDALYNGALEYIAEDYIGKLNDSFDKHECINCGEVHEKTGANNTASFL